MYRPRSELAAKSAIVRNRSDGKHAMGPTRGLRVDLAGLILNLLEHAVDILEPVWGMNKRPVERGRLCARGAVRRRRFGSITVDCDPIDWYCLEMS